MLIYFRISLYNQRIISWWWISLNSKYLQGGPKKSLWCDLEEKCLRNSKIFFDGVFPSMYSHLLKKLELFKLCIKKSNGALKILKMACSKKVTLSKKRHIFLFLFLFLLQDKSYSCSVLKFQVSKLKIAIVVIKLSMRPQKCLFLKRL